MQTRQAKSHSPNTAPTKTAEAPQKAAVSAASASRVPAWAGGMNDQIPGGLVLQSASTLPGIQAKLAINQPNDPYEQEADRVAEHVMRTPASPAPVERKCACGGIAGPTGECEACAAKRKALQRRATQSAAESTAPPVVNQVLSSGNGQPLDAGTRAFMEPRFGTDFSQVRVHTDGQAAESAQSVNALAYTAGSDVVFGKGQYRPETSEGQGLLAHELTHVVQQRDTPAANDIQLAGGPAHAPLEREAESVASQVTQFTTPEPLVGHISQSPMILHRKEGEGGEHSDSEKRQLLNIWKAEAKADVERIKLLLQDDNIFHWPQNRREIMAIVRKWGEKTPEISLRLTPFDLFIVAMETKTYTISSWGVDQWTNVFDQFHDRMDSEAIEQFNAWKQSQARFFKDEKPNELVKFEVTKVIKEAGQLALELGCDALTEGACELLIIGKWLLVDLPDLYNKATAVIGLVNTLRNLKLDDVKKLFSAVGLADLLVKALFGEVRELPTLGEEKSEQETEAEPASGGDEKGLVKLLHGVFRVFNALKRAYSRVARVVNQSLATVNIRNQKWFEPFSMAYAGAVHSLEAISNSGAVLNDAAAKLSEIVGTFFSGIKTKVDETVGEIKAHVEKIGNPAQLLHKLVDKVVEMTLNLLISHPPSPLIKLLFRVVEAVSKESIVQFVREKVPLANQIIDKIVDSDLVQEEIVEPLKPPIARVTSAIDSVATEATGVIDNVQHKVETTLGDGMQMIKEFAGVDPTQARSESASGEGEEAKKPAKAAPKEHASGDFLGIIKHGIHTRLLAIGDSNLAQAGKVGLKKVTEGAKSLAVKVLGKTLGFDVDKKHHELWAEDEGTHVTLHMKSDNTEIDKKIELYTRVFSQLKDPETKKKAEKLVKQLANLNKKAQPLRKKEDAKVLEATERQMIPLIEQLEQLMPATEFKTEFVVPSGATVRLTRDFIILVCDGTSCKEIDTYKNHQDKMGGVGKALNVHHLLEKRFLDSLDQLRRQSGIPPLNVNKDDVNSVVLPSVGKELDDLITRYPAAQALKEIPSRHLWTPKLERGTPDAPWLSVSGELQSAVSGIRNVKGKKYAGAVTAGEIFEVHRDLYTDMGRPSWIQAIRGYFKGLL